MIKTNGMFKSHHSDTIRMRVFEVVETLVVVAVFTRTTTVKTAFVAHHLDKAVKITITYPTRQGVSIKGKNPGGEAEFSREKCKTYLQE